MGSTYRNSRASQHLHCAEEHHLARRSLSSMEASLVACESFSALPRSEDASISSRTSPSRSTSKSRWNLGSAPGLEFLRDDPSIPEEISPTVIDMISSSSPRSTRCSITSTMHMMSRWCPNTLARLIHVLTFHRIQECWPCHPQQ